MLLECIVKMYFLEMRGFIFCCHRAVLINRYIFKKRVNLFILFVMFVLGGAGMVQASPAAIYFAFHNIIISKFCITSLHEIKNVLSDYTCFIKSQCYENVSWKNVLFFSNVWLFFCCNQAVLIKYRSTSRISTPLYAILEVFISVTRKDRVLKTQPIDSSGRDLVKMVMSE